MHKIRQSHSQPHLMEMAPATTCIRSSLRKTGGSIWRTSTSLVLIPLVQSHLVRRIDRVHQPEPIPNQVERRQDRLVSSHLALDLDLDISLSRRCRRSSKYLPHLHRPNFLQISGLRRSRIFLGIPKRLTRRDQLPIHRREARRSRQDLARKFEVPRKDLAWRRKPMKLKRQSMATRLLSLAGQHLLM